MLVLLTLVAAFASFSSAPCGLWERSQAMTICPQMGHTSASNVPTWVFDEHHTRTGDPQTTVFLRVHGKHIPVLRNVIAHFDLIGRQGYKDHHIPTQVVAACSGWWAGQGEDLYAIRSKKRVTVFIRYLDEEAPASAFKRLKSIAIH